MATIPKTTYELDETGFRVARLKAYLGHNHSYAVLTVQRFNDVLASLKRTNSVLDELRQIRSNRDLSTEGQRKRVYDVAHKFLSDVLRNAESLRDQIVSATTWLPQVPAVSDDTSAADLDIELRGAFRELSESERSALLPQMMQGAHPELMKAILRTPRILSKLTEEQYDRLKRRAIASFQRELVEAVTDASYLAKQIDAAVGRCFSAVLDVAGRSIDVRRPVIHDGKLRDLDEVLRSVGGSSIDPKEWFEAAISAQAKTPEIAKQRIEAAHEARRAALREGKGHLEAERLAQIAADSIPDPDEREPGTEAA